MSVSALDLVTMLLASGAPTWVWTTLVVAAFFGLSVLTVVLARFPAQRTPPPLVTPPNEPRRRPEGDESASERSED